MRAQSDQHTLPVHADVIAKAAQARQIDVSILDPSRGELRLTSGHRSYLTWESLSERANPVAVSRCQDKDVTRRLLEGAGFNVPVGEIHASLERSLGLLSRLGSVVIKPIFGEGGLGVHVDINTPRELTETLRCHGGVPVLVEEFVDGEDIRVIVIGGKVAAAALRIPPSVIGDGRHTVQELVGHENSQRMTRLLPPILLDQEAMRTLSKQSLHPGSVPANGEKVSCRKTANVHTGGSIRDITSQLSPRVVEQCLDAAHVLGMEVVGFDLIKVRKQESREFVFIEANERPGLANHAPMSPADAFLDYLFDV